MEKGEDRKRRNMDRRTSLGVSMKEILKYKGFIIDMDGVVYREKEVIEGSREAIKRLKELGKKIVFISNNSTRSREEYMEKLRDLNLPIEIDEIMPATYALATYLSRKYPDKKVFVLGTLGLIKELLWAGIKITEDEEKADLLVTGSDLNISYEKFKKATRILLAGKPWIATNKDKLHPTQSGLVPGAGLIVGALSFITGREPEIIGKPSKNIVEEAIKKIGVKKEECIIIGDLIESDILAGKNAGIATALVLSGATNREDLKKSSIKPDYVLERLFSIFE